MIHVDLVMEAQMFTMPVLATVKAAIRNLLASVTKHNKALNKDLSLLIFVTLAVTFQLILVNSPIQMRNGLKKLTRRRRQYARKIE